MSTTNTKTKSKVDHGPTHVRIGPCRLSFPSLLKPKANDQGVLKYETTCLLPPGYDTAPLLAALWHAWHEKFGKDQKKWPKGPTVRTPDKVIRDCSEKPHLAGYEEGWSFVSLRSDGAPEVVDRDGAAVLDFKEVYPGRWAYVTGNAYIYSKPTTGATFGLNNVMLRKHDTSFGGSGPKASTEFDDIADEDDDEGSFD
jgi:hypothetical protein